jgi:hypothetical protein
MNNDYGELARRHHLVQPRLNALSFGVVSKGGCGDGFGQF